MQHVYGHKMLAKKSHDLSHTVSHNLRHNTKNFWGFFNLLIIIGAIIGLMGCSTGYCYKTRLPGYKWTATYIFNGTFTLAKSFKVCLLHIHMFFLVPYFLKSYSYRRYFCKPNLYSVILYFLLHLGYLLYCISAMQNLQNQIAKVRSEVSWRKFIDRKKNGRDSFSHKSQKFSNSKKIFLLELKKIDDWWKFQQCNTQFSLTATIFSIS